MALLGDRLVIHPRPRDGKLVEDRVPRLRLADARVERRKRGIVEDDRRLHRVRAEGQFGEVDRDGGGRGRRPVRFEADEAGRRVRDLVRRGALRRFPPPGRGFQRGRHRLGERIGVFAALCPTFAPRPPEPASEQHG